MIDSGSMMVGKCPPDFDHYDAYHSWDMGELEGPTTPRSTDFRPYRWGAFRRYAIRIGIALGAAAVAYGALVLEGRAADLPTKAVVPPVAYQSTFTWTGFYVGGFGGYGMNNSDNASVGSGGPASTNGFNCSATPTTGVLHGPHCGDPRYALDPSWKGSGTPASATWAGAPVNLGNFGGVDSLNPNSAGVVFGGRAGYNLQVNRIVLGIEDEFAWSGIKGSQSVNGLGFSPNLSGFGPGNSFTQNSFGSISTSLNWYDTLVARIGWTPWNDVLFYGKIGGAFAGVSTSAVVGNQLSLVTAGGFSGNLGLTQAGSGDTTKAGLAWGGGIEYALGTSGWTVRLDYTQLDLGTVSYAITGVPTGTLVHTTTNSVTTRNYNFGGVNGSVSQSLNYGIITAGLDYKF